MTKEYRKVPYEKFAETLKLLKVSEGELAEMLGYSSSGASGWKKEGKMPAVAALACSALLAEKAVPDRFIFVTMCQGKPIESRVFTGLDSIQLGGKQHYLVPMS